MSKTHIRPPPAGAFDAVARFALADGPAASPPEVQRRAALLLLDTLGVCAAAAPMEAGALARSAATRLFAAGSPEDSAPMLFDGRRVGLAGAAFAAASQIDNLDAHDGYNPTKGHVGVVAAPALAALAEGLPDLTGPEALDALLVCYEIAGRAGIALHATVSDYHTSGAWNALGVAAMAARLRGQSPDVLREALGIAEYHGPRSQMMREIATPTMLHDGSGWGALAGLTAAILAEEGFTGAPAITVEAADAAPHWADLGAVWHVAHSYVKPYPVCRWAHAAIDAAAALRAEHALRAEMVAEIRVRSFDYAVALFPGVPSTTSEAQYSLPFAVACMIAHGRIGLAEISGDGLADPTVAGLVARTRMIAEARFESRYPEGRWASVEIALTDGRVVDSGDVHARGGPERPFSEDDIIAKFMDYAGPVLGTARAAAVRDAACALDRPESRFADLLRLIVEPA
jgi:2-methylcitrate dehydratase PrpD